MTTEVTPDHVDNAKLLMALDKARGRTSDEWIVRLANAKPAPPEPMTAKITPDQVDNGRLLLAIDQAAGRTSDEWVVRLANAGLAFPG